MGWSSCAQGGGPATRPASPTLIDIAGTARAPLDLGTAKAVVVIFISVDCPISNGYAPEIIRMCKDFEPKGACFYLVHADPQLSDPDAKKHADEYGYTCPVLVDRKHELVRRLGVKATPEAAIVNPAGEILYRGRVDDLYAGLGRRRYEATQHDLRDALSEVLAGRPVKTPRTVAVGCAIGEN